MSGGRFPRRDTRANRHETVQLQPLLSRDPLTPPDSPGPVNLLENATAREYDRFSTVAMEMLREREDCDLHPYGRGGRFEGFLYDARRVKVNTDHSKLFTWLLFFFSLVLLSGSIIYLAEMDRQRHLHAYLNRNVTTTTPTAAPTTTTTSSPSATAAPST